MLLVIHPDDDDDGYVLYTYGYTYVMHLGQP